MLPVLPAAPSAPARALDLAEQLRDKISRARHSWKTVATTARLLADPAGAMARRS